MKWVLQGNGRIQVVRKGKIQKLEKVGDLPGGKVDFWSVELHRRYFGRGLLPGELERLGRFQTLKHLRVWGFSVPPEDWEFLAGLHQLQWVYISNTIFDTRSGRWLGQSPQLSALELTSCEGLSAEFFRGLAAGVPGLQVLRISGSKIQDADGCELARFERLESLVVDSTGLTSAVLPSWAGFRHLKTLQLFDGPWPREGLEALSRSPIESFGLLNVDDPEFLAQMALVGELFPKLKALKFKGKEFGANQAQAVFESCKNLEELDVQSALPSLEAAKILARMPHLQSVTCRAPGMGDPVFQELLASRTLQELDVVGTQVSDQSAEAIRRAGMNGLRKLTVVGTRISKGTAASLERRTKGLEVHVLPTVQEPER